MGVYKRVELSMATRILTRSDLQQAVDMNTAIDAVERALGAFARGEALMPPKVYLSLPQFNGDFRAMPAYQGDAAGVKWVNSHPDNHQRFSLPTVMGLYILSEAETALPLAVLDGTYLTALRTGAAAAVASRQLAPPSPTTLGLLGCGVQARFLLDSHRAVFPQIDVMVADRDPDVATAFAERHHTRVVEPEQLGQCDILCTSTPSRTPIVQRDWLGSHPIHINAMGADAEGKQELHSSILNDARVFIDDFEQTTHSGEINVPITEGTYRADQITGTLGEVINGDLPARSEGSPGITLFDSTGLAIQDLAVASAIFNAAQTQDLGQCIDFLN